MENASKALLMAASILIGVVILTLGVYLYTSFSESANNMKKQMEDNQIANFNNQFLLYEGKTDLTIYDVYTVANLAIESNKKYELKDEGIQVVLNNVNIIDTENNKNSLEYTEFIDNYMYVSGTHNNKDVIELKKFTCSIEMNEGTGRIGKVEFTENET